MRVSKPIWLCCVQRGKKWIALRPETRVGANDLIERPISVNSVYIHCCVSADTLLTRRYLLLHSQVHRIPPIRCHLLLPPPPLPPLPLHHHHHHHLQLQRPQTATRLLRSLLPPPPLQWTVQTVPLLLDESSARRGAGGASRTSSAPSSTLHQSLPPEFVPPAPSSLSQLRNSRPSRTGFS